MFRMFGTLILAYAVAAPLTSLISYDLRLTEWMNIGTYVWILLVSFAWIAIFAVCGIVIEASLNVIGPTVRKSRRLW